MGVFSNGGASKTLKASGVTQEPEETEADRPCNTVRLKNETKEEKKQRKQEVKTDRKVSSSMFKNWTSHGWFWISAVFVGKHRYCLVVLSVMNLFFLCILLNFAM